MSLFRALVVGALLAPVAIGTPAHASPSAPGVDAAPPARGVAAAPPAAGVAAAPLARGVAAAPPALSGTATPPDPGVTATTIWQRRVAGTELTRREIRIPPGDDTGWHYHDGRLYVRVKQGTLWHYDESCRPDGVYRAGRFLTERGGRDNVHIGRNLGRTDLVLDVLYVLPAGSPFVEDAANPGCSFG